MGKLKCETQHRDEQDRMRNQEIVECGEKRLEEVKNYTQVPFLDSVEYIEAIDIDDITALMECGKDYTVEELVEQFGISVDSAKSLLTRRNCIEISDAIAESETAIATNSNFDSVDVFESAEPFDGNLPLDTMKELSDEEYAQMAYALEHAFD